MYVNNLIHSSDFVTLVPMGMPTTLEFNEIGNLKKVYWGFGDNKKDVSAEIFSAAKVTDEIKPFPFKINLSGGVTFVEGVIVRENPDQYKDSIGKLPDCIFNQFMNEFTENSSAHHFIAANIYSGALEFKGCTNIRRWLDMNGFDILPGFLAPGNINESTFNECVKHCGYPFSVIASYIIFRGTEVIHETTHLDQYKVKSVSKSVDEYGYIKANIKVESDCDVSGLVISYGNVPVYNIHPNSILVCKEFDNIAYTYSADNKVREKRSFTLICDTCGKKIQVKDKFEVCCPEEDCLSRIYPKIQNLVHSLNLPEISYEACHKAVKDGKLTTLIDVLYLDQYKNMSIKVSAKQLLRAVTPIDIIPDDSFFGMFANQCNNNVNTILFYIKNPNKIENDLELNEKSLIAFISWLGRASHNIEVQKFFEYPNIEIVGSDKKFDGDPILRNKLIMITGSFKHGSHDDIIAILQSYSAEVTTEYDQYIDCLIVGDMQENVNGQVVRLCKARNIPIFTESDFFNRYYIDEDLARFVG